MLLSLLKFEFILKPDSVPIFYSCFQTTPQQTRFFMLKNMMFVLIKSQRYTWSFLDSSQILLRVFRVLAQFQTVKRKNKQDKLYKNGIQFWTDYPSFLSLLPPIFQALVPG